MYKVVQYNSINNKNGIIEYDTNVIKVTTTYLKALEYAIEMKKKTKKLYKIERV